MKYYEVSEQIDARPEDVWAILIDGAAYPGWDSGVVRVEGQIAQGERVKVYSALMPDRAFPVTVTELVPARRMVWSGGMPLGLFRGVRTFTLSATGERQTAFVMREEFTGPMLPLIWRSMPDLGPSFRQFATGLKQRAEQAA